MSSSRAEGFSEQENLSECLKVFHTIQKNKVDYFTKEINRTLYQEHESDFHRLYFVQAWFMKHR